MKTERCLHGLLIMLAAVTIFAVWATMPALTRPVAPVTIEPTKSNDQPPETQMEVIEPTSPKKKEERIFLPKGEILRAEINGAIATMRRKYGVMVSKEKARALLEIEEETGIFWQILAAQFKNESSFGVDKNMYAYMSKDVLRGKQLQYFQEICRLVGRNPKTQGVSANGEMGPMQFCPNEWIKYGSDANGDGIADPWALEDALLSAAKKLNADGYFSNTIWTALVRYNGGQVYAGKVCRDARDMGAPLLL